MRFSWTMTRPLWAAVVLGVLGCGGDEVTPAGSDAGPGFAFTVPDGKTGDTPSLAFPETGGTIDSGAPTDPGGAEDPGAPTDPGTTPSDTGPADTGPAADLGCKAKCAGKACGPDGCGGQCGTCPDKQVCTAGQCGADPTLGCEGLDLPENWKGEFEGKVTFQIIGLIPLDAKTHGDLEFSIKCFNTKLIVSGKMTGQASDNPFELDMSGSYDPKQKKISITLKNGHVLLWGGVLEYWFDGTADSTLQADKSFKGPWTIKSYDMKVIGMGGNAAPLTGSGTWSAAGK